MEENDPDVVDAARTLWSFTNHAAAPERSPKPTNFPPAGRKMKRSPHERRIRTGWIAAAAKIVEQEAAAAAAAAEGGGGGGGRSSPDSPLDFRRMCEASLSGEKATKKPTSAAGTAAAKVGAVGPSPLVIRIKVPKDSCCSQSDMKPSKKARLEEALKLAMEEKQKLQNELEEWRRKEELLAATRTPEELPSLETSAPASTSTPTPTVADEEKQQPGESPRIAPPSSSSYSSSSLRSRGVKFLPDLNLPPPVD